MKKKHAEEHENLERWLVSYADFITLLFAFFTVLYALSQTDKTKYKEAVEAIEKAFLTGGGSFPTKGAPFSAFDKKENQGSKVPPSPADTAIFSITPQPDVKKIEDELRKVLENTTGIGAAVNDLEVVPTEDGFAVRMADYVLFKSGSEKIRPESVGFLLELGRRLKSLEAPIQVEGHTDNQALGAGRSNGDNWKLSVGRAYNVLQFFLEGVNYPTRRISMAGYADNVPVADNSTPQGRQRNRRVEIHVRLRQK